MQKYVILGSIALVIGVLLFVMCSRTNPPALTHRLAPPPPRSSSAARSAPAAATAPAIPPAVVENMATSGPAGGFLMGRFYLRDGSPVTNGNVFLNGATNFHPLFEIDAEGQYSTAFIPAGRYTVKPRSPELEAESAYDVVVGADMTVIQDFVFAGPQRVRGVVIDLATRQPIPNVIISNCYADDRANLYSPYTDTSGEFELSSDCSTSLIFMHENYPQVRCEAYELRKMTRPIVQMSATGRVRVSVRNQLGQPVTNAAVHLGMVPQGRLRYDDAQGYTDAAGVCVYSNVPGAYSPVCISLYLSCAEQNWSSESVAVRPGEEVALDVVLPPAGDLRVRFLAPIEQFFHAGITDQHLSIVAEGLNPGCSSLSFYPDISASQDFCFSGCVTGAYELAIYRDTLRSHQSTSVVIEASMTTTWTIDPRNRRTGVIRGRIVDTNGKPVSKPPLEVELSRTEHYQYYSPWSVSISGTFEVTELDANELYDVVSHDATWERRLRGIAPNGPPVTLVVPAMYSVWGTAVNTAGRPLLVRAGVKYLQQPRMGEFRIEQLDAGPHTLVLRAAGYAPRVMPVQIAGQDVDLGEVVFSDRGIDVIGRVVNEQGQPQLYDELSVELADVPHGRTKYFYLEQEMTTDENGGFVLRNLPCNQHLVLGRNPRAVFYDLGYLSASVTNLGDLAVSAFR